MRRPSRLWSAGTGAGLRLQRIWATNGPVTASGRIENWQLPALTDLGSFHGARLRDRWRQVPDYACHRDIVDAVLRGHQSQEWDAVVVAHGSPDVTLFESVGCYLSSTLAGEPFVFGLDEGGRATAMMAMRLLQQSPARSTSGRRLLILLDQPETVFDLGESMPQGTVAVAVELGPDPRGAAVRVRLETGVSASEFPSRAGGLLRSVEDERGKECVVLGPVAADRSAGLVRLPSTSPGPPIGCAATWLPLARHWPEWSDSEATVVVVEHDVDRQLLATCRLDFGGRELEDEDAAADLVSL